MDKYLRPERFDADSTSNSSSKEWQHWKMTFENFLTAQRYSPSATDSPDAAARKEAMWNSTKLQLLINHITPRVYATVSECTTYTAMLAALDKLYVKAKNVIHARHLLATRRQQADESIDAYLQALKQLAKDCEFTAVDAETNKNDSIRGAFIAGISSNKIRERLLENLTLTLEQSYNKAQSMEMAERNSHHFTMAEVYSVSNVDNAGNGDSNTSAATAAAVPKRKCFFCGASAIHPRKDCPARDATCVKCNRKGHYGKVCRSRTPAAASTTATDDCGHCSCIISAAAPISLRKAMVTAFIKGVRAEALIDTGSSLSFVNEDFANLCQLKKRHCEQTISMASLSHKSQVNGSTLQNVRIGDNIYNNVNLLIVKNLCADVIIGHDVLESHSTLEFKFGGPKDTLKVCSVAAASVPAVPLFTNVTADCKPIAVKSRKHSIENNAFIKAEVEKLLKEGIIEESLSPWRAQVLITKNVNHKKRMVIDYSQTINKYTELDAYPLPNIEEMITKVAKYAIFSAIDLQSAYHQVPILPDEKTFTAFEACGNLYQFRRIPFGVTNGVSSFQRTVDWLIRTENLNGTFAYIDDITVCGKTQEEHDKNLRLFLKAAEKYNLTLNKEKSKFTQSTINILGYTIENHVIKPDSERLKPLLNMPPPNDVASLRRTLGMFAHYSKWIPSFSQRIHPMAHTKSFPLSSDAVKCFEDLKSVIAKSSVHAINDKVPFTVETDASEHSIAATLSQDSRPVAFYSRTLNQSERNHSAVEKEAYAIVEALKKWRHFLIGRPFKLITDQRSVSFMFDAKHTSKIKNEKIQRWRLELAPYRYDIMYRPGKENHVADTLSRVCASIESRKSRLLFLHETMCHPGVTRMYHWLKIKNLPYTVDEVRAMTANCRICAEIKPRYFKNPDPLPKLIKATSPMERLSIDFKGPIPSKTNNRFILTVIDEYSRFPFAFPCSDISAKTVIKHLNSIFMIFGFPSYIHSDRGRSFLSSEEREFLHSRGIATSRTTAYNPQVEPIEQCL